MSRVPDILTVLALAPWSTLAAQEPAAAELKTVVRSPLRYVVRVPPGYSADKWVPMIVVFANEYGEAAAQVAAARVAKLVDAGFVAVAPVLGDLPDLRPLFRELRRTFRIDQGGMHLLLTEASDDAVATVLAHRYEFQTIHSLGVPAPALLRLPARRAGAVPAGPPENGLATFFTRLHRQRTLPGVAGEVTRVLDDFHDAAANADEARYFAILPDDGVFLGTDGTERWTGAQFKRDYMKYFERDSAWTYVTLRREVNVEPGDTIAWFDETFDHEAYGECRGSGVVCKRDGRWVLRQYHLTVPVPNDVTREVAARIRAFQDGVPLAQDVTTIVLVRHAEKAGGGEDPELSETGKQRAVALARTLRDVRVDDVYTSQFRRTATTVTEVIRGTLVTPVEVPANNVAGLVQRLRSLHTNKTVLVCGHSNTVPAIVKALGVAGDVKIADDEYDRMFVVTLVPNGTPRMLSLRYGP